MAVLWQFTAVHPPLIPPLAAPRHAPRRSASAAGHGLLPLESHADGSNVQQDGLLIDVDVHMYESDS